MRLSNKALVYFLLAAMITLSGGGAGLYTLIRQSILRQVDETLQDEKDIIEEEIQHTDSIPDFTTTFNHKIEVIVYMHPVEPEDRLKDTVVYDDKSKMSQIHRQLIYANNTNEGKGYIIRTSLSIEEELTLLDKILFIIFSISFSLLILLVILNYGISRRLWKGFYTTLRKIDSFDIKTNYEFEQAPTRIKEFKQLNAVLERLTEKIRNDYKNLKEFSENATHEIQTPLSVIRSQVEQMLQSPDINSQRAGNLQTIGKAVTRISRINHALILISRIQNDQFTVSKLINLNEKIRENIAFFGELTASKEISVDTEMDEDVLKEMNPDLADILVGNLFSNAVKHNIQGGSILIRLNHEYLEISNSGQESDADPSRFFERFNKANPDSGSPGLGLAIIRKITDLYKMEITYSIEGELHLVRIKF